MFYYIFKVKYKSPFPFSTLKQLKHTQQQEEIIMKDVPDWVVGESVYHTKRWVRPRVEDLYFLANSKEQREAMFGYNTFV